MVGRRGQAADIVVALDGDRWSAGEADTLDHIGIQRALRQEIGAADLLGLALEHIDEGLADELALGLGVGDAGKAVEEQRRGIHMHQRINIHDDITFVLPYDLDLIAAYMQDVIGPALVRLRHAWQIVPFAAEFSFGEDWMNFEKLDTIVGDYHR